MSNYRRPAIAGGYFITQVTYQRIPWLCSDLGRKALREAIAKVRGKYSFEINAFVLLPDRRSHCIIVLQL
jgi:putative transposase